MAIGDVIADLLGTGIENRQPPEGVEEQISAIIKSDVTDPINFYDGSTTLAIIGGGFIGSANAASTLVAVDVLNISVMITNADYLRKTGTSDAVGISGVQTNV